MIRILMGLLLFALLPGSFAADPESRVPEALLLWVPWALGDQDLRDCPVAAAGGERLCAWPGRLHLDLDAEVGLFAQRWRVYAESWIPLPGSREYWPQDVRVGAAAVPVVERNGAPGVKLDPGEHAISGNFVWSALPEGLEIPPATGLVLLSIGGEPVAYPRLESDGRLWLGDRASGGDEVERDTLVLEVYRRVEDDIPLRVITRLDLDVAGRAREVRLGPVLLDSGIALRVDSPLPTRLEPDGLLRLQVRPGRWVVEIAAHHQGPIAELALGEHPEPWPAQEVWAFSAHPELRQVQIAGAELVDPRQTRLPTEWTRLPAYLMQPGQALGLVQIRRGDAEPAPDRLSLSRDLWLDFDGGGYTLRDHITGALVRSWRLEVGAGLDLGQALVDGQPRFITRLGDSPREGVEVRQGRLDLVADSRIEGDLRRLPASGWELDPHALQTRLHLPPGWSLLAVGGVDNVPDSWVDRWTLLDLFLVLIIALAVARLWSWGWGAVALLTMVLIWQEPDAPRIVWLNVLAAFALMRLLPQEPARAAVARLRGFLAFYFRVSLVALLLIGLPFLVDQVRNGLYPQLDRPWSLVSEETDGGARPAASAFADDLSVESFEVLEKAAGKRAPAPLMGAAPLEPSPLPVVDPDARVQTGPGVPEWHWNTVELGWSGPVSRDHEVDLWLLSPGWSLALALLRVVLLVLLGLQLAGLLRGVLRRAPVAAVLLLAVGLSGTPAPGIAQEFPSPEMLESLRERLLEPPDCLSACADIPRMELETTEEALHLVLTVDAQEAVAVPVPGGTDVWTPTRSTLEGGPLDSIRRAEDGTYLVAVPAGRWLIELSGPLPPRAQVEIPLPLRPRQVQVKGDAWRVEGIDENGRPGAQIQLVRLRREAAEQGRLEPSEVPPLVRVQRTLHLGVDWWIETKVTRLSPREPPLVLEVPLLDGEQVLSDSAQVRDGSRLVSLAPGQQETGWTSNLEPVDAIGLRASEDARLSEEWRVEVSPLWHLEAAGIPVIHHLGRLERWLPTWRPWPGEEVSLAIIRPAGVPGPTLTLDSSSYRIRPGRRVTEAELDITLRSSQGGQQDIELPEGAELQRATVDGVERPLRLEGRKLTLPLVPGSQRFGLQWWQPGSLDLFYSPPVPDLGTAGVNASVHLGLGQDRWVLLAGGPRVGPAVLFWGLVVVLVPLSLGLARVRLTPLRWADWLLLGLGLSQAGVWIALLVAAWLFALGVRARVDVERLPPWRFNILQTGLLLISLAALAALVAAVQQGLLGPPQMQIAGNGSSATSLSWYQDQSSGELPQVWLVSVPLLVYRTLMLAWALWLAFRLLAWLRWGWQNLSTPLLWRDVKLKLPRRKGRVKPRGAAAMDSPDPT